MELEKQHLSRDVAKQQWRTVNLPPPALYTGLGMACGSGNGIDDNLISLPICIVILQIGRGRYFVDDLPSNGIL